MATRRQFLGGDRYEVASAVVYALPGRQGELRIALAAMPGVEVHAETPDGRFIVTVEPSARATAGDNLLALHNLEGVIAAALVSHYENV
jgi:nitrate reductase NapD